MKMMIKELDSHSLYFNFDTTKDSKLRRVSFRACILDDEKIVQTKTAHFTTSTLEDARNKLEEFFEFENEATRNEVMKPLIDHFSAKL